MGFFNRSDPGWNPKDIPNLSFDGPTDFVDIGFLGGDDHRDAFVEIFRKMLADNEDALLGLVLVGVDAKRPVDSNTAFPVELFQIDANQLARDLYDSHNNKLYLRLESEASQVRMGVIFDNPSFWVEKVGA